MTRFSKLGTLFAIGALAFIATPSASANAELILSDGNGHTATIAASGCGAGCELASFNGTLGDWNINVTTGTGAPGQSPLMDLNSINHHNASGTATTLTMEWSFDGFTPAVPGFQLNIGGTVGANGTVTASLFGGTSNTLFDLSNQIGTTMSFTNPPISFSGVQNAFMTGLTTNPYALTEVATISFGTSAGQASFDYSVDAIPEPAGVLLLGSVMLLTVSLVRRRVGTGDNRA
jgi:hypothetical protein